jgi:hypothetical protein
MTYRTGNVTMKGDRPSNVLALAFGRKTPDDGKARQAVPVAAAIGRLPRPVHA